MFFLLGILNLSTSVLVAPLGAWIMDRQGALFTYSLAIPVLLIPLLILFVIPRRSSPPPAVQELDEYEPPQSDIASTGPFAMALKAVKKRLHGAVQHIRCDILPMLHSTAILSGLFSIFVLSFSENSGDVLLQYMRVRFKWRYEEVYKPLQS
jgi:hypothetical protein